LTTFLINDNVAIDAGSVGLMSPVVNQRRVKHLFLSHSHIDHLASLPLFLDNVFAADENCPTIYASQGVWDVLTNDVLNDRLWPNLSRIAGDEFRFYAEAELFSEVPIQVGGLTVTPVSIDHLVPTFGFLIEDEHSSLVIVTDTGPTQRIWELAGQSPFRQKLRAVFLECSFPNSHEWLANKSKHLCPRLFAEELKKITAGGSFLTVAIHLKAAMYEQTVAELNALKLSNIVIGGQDQSWELSMEAVEVTTFYLEMLESPGHKVPAPCAGLTVQHVRSPSVAYYRSLYDPVGEDYNWRSRRKMSEAELLAIIGNPLDELHVLHVDGVPAGFAELDRRQPNEIELVQFGLKPDFIGRGLGKWFLQAAIDIAWSYHPQRFWVHTCTLDHPAALPNYTKAGFKQYKEEVCLRVKG
jgi:ribonuclease BN (tRNA processing enzyme)/GNAT superfamily N-acetyltransferase